MLNATAASNEVALLMAIAMYPPMMMVSVIIVTSKAILKSYTMVAFEKMTGVLKKGRAHATASVAVMILKVRV